MVAAFVQGLRRRLARDKWALVKAADMRRVLSPLCATSEAELAPPGVGSGRNSVPTLSSSWASVSLLATSSQASVSEVVLGT